MAKPQTTIVVPVLNEADNVMPLIHRVSEAVSAYNVEVLFVDDSKDTKTVEIVRQAQKIYRSRTFSVGIYHRVGEANWGGLSGAVSDGFKRARSDQVIVMDGDLQHPPEVIPSLIEAAKEADIVIASRYREGGSASGLDGNIRHIVSRGSTLLAKAFFPLRLRPVTDPMTGFFLVNRNLIDSKRLRPKGFKILLEILAAHPQLSVREVPLQFAEREAGESHGDLKQGIEFFKQLVDLRLRQFIHAIDRIPKFIRFGAIGGGVFVIGMALLYLMVDVFDWPLLAANAIQLGVTFWLNYVLNRKLTWGERKVGRMAIHKFISSRAATTVLNYLMFVWLTTKAGPLTFAGLTIDFASNYLAANVLTLIIVTAINYIVSDRWAFAEQKDTDGRVTKKLNELANRLPDGSVAALFAAGLIGFSFTVNPLLTISALLAIASLVLFFQSSFEVWRIMYAFREPQSVDDLRFPAQTHAREKFCIIVPARHESAVLAGTLRQLAKQTHPNVDIISVMCDDDHDTLKVAHEVAKTEPKITVMAYPLAGKKPSKPKQLNYVFSQIKDKGYTVIGIIDAEDTVQPDLLMHVDTAFRDHEVGIVQGGVQLMNHDSSWYSLHNVLEYYRWFNSAMSFQADNQFMPLGGNTIFVRTELLEKAGGWPETLTEDCSLGVLISSRFPTKIAVYYEPRLATREETPDSVNGLFKQRVRWNQGFFHEWRKGVWRDLPGVRQRLLAEYVLLSPVLMAATSILLPLSLLTFLFLDAPVGLVMLMYLPLIPSLLNVILNAVLLSDFGKAFERQVKKRHYVILFATQAFYQIVLSTAAFWAVVRELRGEYSWYKTPHTGQHRAEPAFVAAEAGMLAEEKVDA